MFRQAERKQSKLRMTIDGPAGSGKSYTSLRMAHALAAAYGGKIAAVDTERGSLSKYVGDSPDGVPWIFDVLELTKFSPEEYTNAIQAAGRMGYTILLIDSLSHAWEGQGGALEIKDRAGGADWKAWRTVTPIHNRMVDSILQSPCHVITTMRSRMEYVQETDNTGRIIVRKIGMAPIQRPGMEYEFDVVCDIDWAHILTVSKSRCTAVQDMKVEKPGPAFIQPIIEWLSSGSGRAATPVFATANGQIANVPVTQVQVTLESLMQKYGADAVSLGVQLFLEDKMPTSQADLDTLDAQLSLMQQPAEVAK